MKGIVLAGPTGVGKTALSIKLAKVLGADIVSVDSAQVYKNMDIGTAKVSEEEMDGVIHHMIDVIEPIEKYSVGEFEKVANKIINDIEKPVLLVGGTGLYIDAIVRGLSKLPKGDEKIRERLMNLTGEELFEILKKVDPEAAETIHPNNKRRVERAVEVYEQTGQKFSVLSKENVKGNNIKFLKVALERDREYLYERINLRVNIMMEGGLLEEVTALYEKYGESIKKINIIGYSEIIDFLENKITLEEAVELIKKNSRNYAKRQFTWFKNDEEYLWIDLDQLSENEAIEKILKAYNAI